MSVRSLWPRERRDGAWAATFNGLEDDAGVVVRDDVGIAVLGFVHFQVGMFPRELLARINGLQGKVMGEASGRGAGGPGRGAGASSPRTPGRA